MRLSSFQTPATSWGNSDSLYLQPRGYKYLVQLLSHVQLFVTPWTVVLQGPLSMGFSWQEYWRGPLFPSQGTFPGQGSKLSLLHCKCPTTSLQRSPQQARAFSPHLRLGDSQSSGRRGTCDYTFITKDTDPDQPNEEGHQMTSGVVLGMKLLCPQRATPLWHINVCHQPGNSPVQSFIMGFVFLAWPAPEISGIIWEAHRQ